MHRITFKASCQFCIFFFLHSLIDWFAIAMINALNREYNGGCCCCKLSILFRHRSDGQKTCSPTAVASEMTKKWHSRSRGVASQQKFATPPERERHFFSNSSPTAVAMWVFEAFKNALPPTSRRNFRVLIYMK